MNRKKHMHTSVKQQSVHFYQGPPINLHFSLLVRSRLMLTFIRLMMKSSNGFQRPMIALTRLLRVPLHPFWAVVSVPLKENLKSSLITWGICVTSFPFGLKSIMNAGLRVSGPPRSKITNLVMDSFMTLPDVFPYHAMFLQILRLVLLELSSFRGLLIISMACSGILRLIVLASSSCILISPFGHNRMYLFFLT